jgi:hypothetical protein
MDGAWDPCGGKERCIDGGGIFWISMRCKKKSAELSINVYSAIESFVKMDEF